MGMLKNIFWKDGDKNTIVYRFDMKNDYVSRGSILTVEEGQACVFCHQGKMADVFLPGRYKLDTDSIPIITKLLSWKYGFQNPFRSNIYFVNMTQFTGQKWGTINPIIVRDADYGAVRIRGFGGFAFRVDDPYIFLKELSGTSSTFKTEDIMEHIKSILMMRITDAIGESKIPILDMAGKLVELAKSIKGNIQEKFTETGMTLTTFTIENLTLPKELEEMLDKTAGYTMSRKTLDVEMTKAQMEALKSAAANPGTGGSMGAGMGIGMGLGMGQMFGGMMGNMAQQVQSAQHNNTVQPAAVIPAVAAGSDGKKPKFCPNCGAKLTEVTKFCPECGEKL
jgi:membrane protease subunit (stomatin/prohibitin family)